MRDVRQHEPPLDHLGCPFLQDFARTPAIKCDDRALGIKRRLQCGLDLGGREIAMRAVVEDHIE